MPFPASNLSLKQSGAKPTSYGVPRIAFVNKMDRIGADFFDAVKTMREKLHANAIPVHCPIGAESEFKGMVDLVTMKAYLFHDETLGANWDETEIPADLLEQCQEDARSSCSKSSPPSMRAMKIS